AFAVERDRFERDGDADVEMIGEADVREELEGPHVEVERQRLHVERLRLVAELVRAGDERAGAEVVPVKAREVLDARAQSERRLILSGRQRALRVERAERRARARQRTERRVEVVDQAR